MLSSYDVPDRISTEVSDAVGLVTYFEYIPYLTKKVLHDVGY